jgi:RNA polymerase sigma factor (sigma-70 family)
MSVVEALSEDEAYLAAIIQDKSGVDLAEFCWVDEGSDDNLFRCYDYQYGWYRNDSKLQIDQCGRAVGKSVGIQLRSFAFAFNNAGQEMLITAPELVHLDPVTKYVEDRINDVRLSREMLYKKNGKTGFMHRPFEAKFINGSRIIGRIPQKDGKGVKGQHPRWLEMDEGQDYPQAGWIELTETLRFAADTLSLSTPLREDGDAELGDVVEDRAAESPFEVAATALLPDEIARLLAPLDEREREILKLRFGLDRGEARTLEDVGEEFHLTRERIRQIEARAMSKLRHPSTDTGARDLLVV